MDLNTVKLGGTFDHVVFNPTNNQPIRGKNNKPWTIKLRGTYSTEYQAAISRAQDRRLGAKGKVKVTAAELDMEKTELVLVCVAGWENPPDMDGKELVYDEDVVRSLIASPDRKWLRDQLSDEIENDSNFLPK